MGPPIGLWRLFQVINDLVILQTRRQTASKQSYLFQWNYCVLKDLKRVSLANPGSEVCDPRLPLLPEGRLGAAAGLLEAGVLLCGGLGQDQTAKSSCWLLNLGSSAWKAVEPLPQATAFPAYAALRGGWGY